MKSIKDTRLHNMSVVHKPCITNVTVFRHQHDETNESDEYVEKFSFSKYSKSDLWDFLTGPNVGSRTSTWQRMKFTVDKDAHEQREPCDEERWEKIVRAIQGLSLQHQQEQGTCTVVIDLYMKPRHVIDLNMKPRHPKTQDGELRTLLRQLRQ